MSHDPVAFQLVASLLTWAMITGIVLAFGLVVWTVVLVGSMGLQGFPAIVERVTGGFGDLFGTSSRRVWALAVLTAKEAIRRKTLLVLAVFGVLFLFAGWYLPKSGSDPSQQVEAYVSFVLTATSWLCLPVILLLACWGLPADIKARSLHTVVTKPVRRNEILLGRVLGVTLVGTAVLLIMGIFGHFWLLRALSPEAQARLVARVPVYSAGPLKFFDREGNEAAAGINVGDLWEFRSYIEGNTKARAIWEFEGVTPQRFSDSLRLESRIQVFRSHKGDIESGVLCQYVFVNAAKGIRAAYPAFPVKEFRENVFTVDRKLIDEQNKAVDLFTDLAPDGKLRIEVACLSGGQYLGMARPDLFIRTPDVKFAASYYKALFGIWLIMLMVTVVGVVASCFLKGPVATCLVLAFLVMGRSAHDVLGKVASWNFQGGGMVESVYRILTHINPDIDLGAGLHVKIMKALDFAPRSMLWAVQYIIPNVESCNLTEYTAKGYDVPWDSALLPGLAMSIGFILPCLVLGYFTLKYRELESK